MCGPDLPATGARGEWVTGDSRRLACLYKLCTPLPFSPWLEEVEKLRKVLTSEVRGEPAYPQ